jgi:hypothetical protein
VSDRLGDENYDNVLSLPTPLNMEQLQRASLDISTLIVL